jgi:hypothetical protein
MRLLLVFCLTACATGEVSLNFLQTATPPRPLPPRPPAQVAVLAGKPVRPHVMLGIIESKQTSRWDGEDTGPVVQEMREYAGRRGCDALVVFASHDKTVVRGSTSHTLLGYRAACLVYTGPPAHVSIGPMGSTHTQP